MTSATRARSAWPARSRPPCRRPSRATTSAPTLCRVPAYSVARVAEPDGQQVGRRSRAGSEQAQPPRGGSAPPAAPPRVRAASAPRPRPPPRRPTAEPWASDHGLLGVDLGRHPVGQRQVGHPDGVADGHVADVDLDRVRDAVRGGLHGEADERAARPRRRSSRHLLGLTDAGPSGPRRRPPRRGGRSGSRRGSTVWRTGWRWISRARVRWVSPSTSRASRAFRPDSVVRAARRSRPSTEMATGVDAVAVDHRRDPAGGAQAIGGWPIRSGGRLRRQG